MRKTRSSFADDLTDLHRIRHRHLVAPLPVVLRTLYNAIKSRTILGQASSGTQLDKYEVPVH